VCFARRLRINLEVGMGFLIEMLESLGFKLINTDTFLLILDPITEFEYKLSLSHEAELVELLLKKPSSKIKLKTLCEGTAEEIRLKEAKQKETEYIRVSLKIVEEYLSKTALLFSLPKARGSKRGLPLTTVRDIVEITEEDHSDKKRRGEAGSPVGGSRSIVPVTPTDSFAGAPLLTSAPPIQPRSAVPRITAAIGMARRSSGSQTPVRATLVPGAPADSSSLPVLLSQKPTSARRAALVSPETRAAVPAKAPAKSPAKTEAVKKSKK